MDGPKPEQTQLLSFPSRTATYEALDCPSGKQALQEIADSIQRENRREARWPSDRRKAMTELANLFPTMRGIAGTDPWDMEALISWLNSGAPTSGSKWAAFFLLGVWNPETNWYEYGVKKFRNLRVGKFDLLQAMGVWDYKHVQAMQEWITNPFWP